MSGRSLIVSICGWRINRGPEDVVFTTVGVSSWALFKYPPGSTEGQWVASPVSSSKFSGWRFAARTTAIFLIVAAFLIGLLAYAGLASVREVNEDHSEIRIDRAARAASALLCAAQPGVVAKSTDTGSPTTINFINEAQLNPSGEWDRLVDEISSVNQGAANVFRFNETTATFDRIATSFRTPAGDRAGGSKIEPGLIGAGHPAFDSLVASDAYVGEVPVMGRMRFAYLMPIIDSETNLIGALAVDVGWVDDLNRTNGEVRQRAIVLTASVLALLAIVGVIVMFLAFRPLSRLISIANRLGSGAIPEEMPLRDRRDEIGDLAKALSKVMDLQTDLSVRAFHDDLTGLPNRSHLIHELGERIRRRTVDDQFALFLIDLDQFKEVNDGLGHAAGDELLTSLAAALIDTMQDGEFLARLGGDEFAFISNTVWAEIDAEEVARRISDAVASIKRTAGADISVTCSIGIVRVPQQADTVEIALSHADLALYRAKRTGRAHWRFYQSSLSSPIQRRLHLATELRRAIDAGEVELAYQPLFDATTRTIGGLEALARWNHPVEGAIPPDEFIAVAESTGLITDLGAYLLDLACAQARQWRSDGHIVPTVSVNVSTVQLWQADFHTFVGSLLERYDLPPESLCLELTESVVVHHADGRSQNVLQQLAEIGVKLSIDDFGTGYSSLAYLRDLDVDQVKVDRTFVAGDASNNDRGRLFEGIASLGHSLGLEVVAEGIETELELETARQHGCDLVQGFLLSRPLPPDSVTQFFVSRATLSPIPGTMQTF